MKTDEEQKKKEEQQAQQKAQQRATTNKANWIMPCYGKISSQYGWRIHPVTNQRTFHKGIDIQAIKGTPIKAPMDGIVTFAAYDGPNGNCVRLSHGMINGKNLTSTSIHLNTISVKTGQVIKRGDLIGTVGSTGKYSNGKPSSTGPHLHISVYENGQHVNPLKYIDASAH